MNCKCTSEYNYQIIGLCDVSNIGTKGVLPDKDSWTQITIPEVLTLPGCKPDIESIDKVYINVKITSAEVISTPISPKPSLEGTFLTGRKVLVDGYLCQTIVYTANNCEQTVHTSNFKVPFCTHIVIPGNTDLNLAQFCINACIEDVFARVLTPRTIFKNVTLFLQAVPALDPACI